MNKLLFSPTWFYFFYHIFYIHLQGCSKNSKLCPEGFGETKPFSTIFHHWLIGLVGRVFATGRPGFNPRLCHTKDFKNGT